MYPHFSSLVTWIHHTVMVCFHDYVKSVVLGQLVRLGSGLIAFSSCEKLQRLLYLHCAQPRSQGNGTPNLYSQEKNRVYEFNGRDWEMTDP